VSTIKPDNFSIKIFRTDEIVFFFTKFGGLIPESTQDTTAVVFSTKPVMTYLRRFILMHSCRTETETVSRLQKAGPLQPSVHAAVSLLVSAHGGHYDIEHILWYFCGSMC